MEDDSLGIKRKCDVCTVSSSVMLHADTFTDDRTDLDNMQIEMADEACPDIIAEVYVTSTEPHSESPTIVEKEYPRSLKEHLVTYKQYDSGEAVVNSTNNNLNLKYSPSDMNGLNVLCEAIYSVDNMGTLTACNATVEQEPALSIIDPSLTAIVTEKLKDLVYYPSQNPNSPSVSASGYESGEGNSQMSPDSASQPIKPASSQTQLPPCRVCGERASGFHYGVNTCEACKVWILILILCWD